MRAGILLTVLVVVWAASWPIIKVGVGALPPVWFACLRYAIATAILVAMAGMRGSLRWPSRADRRLVLVSGLLQMGAYSALTSLALATLPPGRAAVLAFSTPLWVHPLAVWRKQERASRRAAAGVVLGLVGIAIIAAPTLARGHGALTAILMLVAAAGAWAVTIVFIRAHRFESTPLALAPWQTAVAAVSLLAIALMTESVPASVNRRAFLALLYVGPVATAFAYWAVVEVGRRLPATTLSVALLATPSLGLVISALTLGETVGVSLLAGMTLVGAGIFLTTTAVDASC